MLTPLQVNQRFYEAAMLGNLNYVQYYIDNYPSDIDYYVGIAAESSSDVALVGYSISDILKSRVNNASIEKIIRKLFDSCPNAQIYLDENLNDSVEYPITDVDYDYLYGNIAPVLEVAPDITPNVNLEVAVDETVTTSNGTYSNNVISYTYQWTLNNVNIPGANSINYTARSEDIGGILRSVVTATNSAGSTVSTSSRALTVIA